MESSGGRFHDKEMAVEFITFITIFVGGLLGTRGKHCFEKSDTRKISKMMILIFFMPLLYYRASKYNCNLSLVMSIFPCL